MSKLLEQQFGDYVEAKSNGNIFPKKGTNARTPYEHQKKAMECLDKMNETGNRAR